MRKVSLDLLARHSSKLDAEHQERRRSQRVLLTIKILVEAEGRNGEWGHTDAYTLAVSAHGGMLETGMHVVEGQNIHIVIPVTGAKQPCKVVRVQRIQPDQYTVAFEFDSPQAKFWPVVAFPLDWELVQS